MLLLGMLDVAARRAAHSLNSAECQLSRSPYANPSMRLPADPATDVPRLARIPSSSETMASLLSAPSSDAAIAIDSAKRAQQMRSSASPLHVPSESRPLHVGPMRTASGPAAAQVVRSALQHRQQTAHADTVTGKCSPESTRSLPNLTKGSSPVHSDGAGQRQHGVMPPDSLDGYVLQVSGVWLAGGLLARETSTVSAALLRGC